MASLDDINLSFNGWLGEQGLATISDGTTQSYFAVNYTAWLTEIFNSEEVLAYLDGLGIDTSGGIVVKLNQNSEDGAPYIEVGGVAYYDVFESFFGGRTDVDLKTGKTSQERWYSDSFEFGANEAPVLAVNGEGSFIYNGDPALISPELLDNTIGVSDADNTTLESAIVSISNNFESGDELHFVDQSGITGSYDDTTGVLTLAGEATLEEYRTALESITFSTTSNDTDTRTISYVVNDGTADSNTATATMSVVVLGADSNDNPDNSDNADFLTTGMTSGDDKFPTSPGGNSGADLVGGGAGNDDLDGGGRDDALYGGSGDDVLSGGGGSDDLYGDAGSDELEGGGGADEHFGGSGDDGLSGGGGTDTLHGDAGDDTLAGNDDNDTLYGGSGNDDLAGGGGADELYGDAGNDDLQGDAGNDDLYGGSGNDIIAGGDDVDIIYGGFGADALTGGAGADTFVFSSLSDRKDTIADFDDAEGDTIDITQIISDAGLDTLTYQELLDGGYLLFQEVDADGGAGTSDARILVDIDGSDPNDPDAGPIAPVVLVDVLNTTLASLDSTNLLV